MTLPESTTTVPKYTRYALALLIGTLLGATIVYAYDSSIKEDTLEALTVRIDSQLTRVESMAEITDRNGADAAAASINKDCSVPERTRFDELLGKLSDTIRWTELNELRQLFSSCGDFYATQKNLMVMRLDREVAVLEDYIDLLTVFDVERSVEGYRVNDWRTLVEQERRQAATFVDLVKIQEQIIDSLLDGKTLNSPEIQDSLQEARDVKELQMVLNIEIDTLRTSLIES